jgi:acylphosphatase
MVRLTKQLLIAGRVQGVGFRFYMERKARELGVTGWVRNRRDGSVEAVVQGTAGAVEAMIAWARRGPPSAVVAEVRVTDASGDYAAFDTRPTE